MPPRHPEWGIWNGMKQRCYNPNRQNYPRYGGKGITVCKEWLESFETFCKDVGPRPPETTLDRIDSSKGYYPENVRWATQSQQSSNRCNNVMLTLDGETKTQAAWAQSSEISLGALRYRLKQGLSLQQALDPQKRKAQAPKLVFNGTAKTLREWAETLGLSLEAVRSRAKKKLPVEEILNPVMRRKLNP